MSTSEDRKSCVLLQLTCRTDFASLSSQFQTIHKELTCKLLNSITDIDSQKEFIEKELEILSNKIGEKVDYSIKAFNFQPDDNKKVYCYLHHNRKKAAVILFSHELPENVYGNLFLRIVKYRQVLDNKIPVTREECIVHDIALSALTYNCTQWDELKEKEPVIDMNHISLKDMIKDCLHDKHENGIIIDKIMIYTDKSEF